MAYWRVSVAYSPHQYNTSTPSQQDQHDATASLSPRRRRDGTSSRRRRGTTSRRWREGLGYATNVPYDVVVALVVEEVVVEAARGLRVEALPALRVLFSIGEHALDRVLEEDVAVVVPPRSL